MEPNNLEEIFVSLPQEQQQRLVKRVLELKAKFTAQDKERERFQQMLEHINDQNPSAK